MQRLILVASAVLCLLLAGGAFGLWKYKQSRPDFSYVPLPFNPDSSEEQRLQTVKEMREKLLTDEVLVAVARDCNIQQKWALPSEQAAVEDLRRRAIFEAGETRIHDIPTPTLNIGFHGKRSENADLQILSKRIMTDVQGLLAPGGSPDDGPAPAKF